MNDVTTGNGKGEGKSLAELAVQRRQEIRKKKILSDSAKLLFSDLTDICFLSKFAVGFGVVRIGKPRLAERLGKSVPSITRAQKELTPSELWTRSGWHEGHEITLWFLRGIADGQLEFDPFTDGVTKAARTRVAPRIPAARNGHGHFCKSDGTTKSQGKEGATADLTVDYGQDCRGTTVKCDGATPSEVTVVNRQTHRSGPVKFDRSERSNVTGVNGQTPRPGPSNGDGGSPSEVTGYKDRDCRNGDNKDLPPTEKQFQQWLRNLDGLFPSRLRDLEKTFTLKLRTVQSPEAKAEWKRRLAVVQDRLLGGPVEDKPQPRPVRADRKPQMSHEQMKKLWDAEKRKLPANVKARAAR